MNKLFFFAVMLLATISVEARAQSTGQYLADKSVIRSSVPINSVMVSSYTPTLVDTQIAGSFVVEVQNRDASNAICCAFDIAMSTVTASAQGKSCRQVAANGGTWVVNRWWQNLKMYCQTLSTSGTSAVVLTQGY